MSRERILWTQWGEHARSILRQYNECHQPYPAFRKYVLYARAG